MKHFDTEKRRQYNKSYEIKNITGLGLRCYCTSAEPDIYSNKAGVEFSVSFPVEVQEFISSK